MVKTIPVIEHQAKEEMEYYPVIFNLNSLADVAAFEALKCEQQSLLISDSIQSQLENLMKLRSPSESLGPSELQSKIDAHLNGKRLDEYGCWVHYPWSNRLVHLLPQNEFIEVRTNRNQNKILPEEQAALATKKVGLIGLSVGHAVAMTLALERGFGELRIADFDELDLSNLNRIRSGVHNLSLPKTVVALRDIAEIDPFLNTVSFSEGITESNMSSFLDGLDLVIEECDSLDIKLRVREAARQKGIPVIMETSDRGMLDVERYDLDSSYPVLHGLTQGLNAESFKDLSTEEKIPVILQIIGIDSSSDGLKQSMNEVGKSILTWPQLGSDVMHGGGAVANVARRILLGEGIDSGRYYVDLHDHIPSSN